MSLNIYKMEAVRVQCVVRVHGRGSWLEAKKEQCEMCCIAEATHQSTTIFEKQRYCHHNDIITAFIFSLILNNMPLFYF